MSFSVLCSSRYLPNITRSTMNKILNQFMYKPDEITGGAPAQPVKSEDSEEVSPPPKTEGDEDEDMNSPPASSAPVPQDMRYEVKEEENGRSSRSSPDDDDDSLFGDE